MIAVYSGASVSALRFVVANDDACGLGSRVRLQAQRGVLYRIAVLGFAGQEGPFVLRWEPAPCIVPYVVGLTLPTARARITAAGCTVGTIRPVSWTIAPRNLVVEQWPPGGRHLPYLGSVRLAVSSGG